MATFKLTAGWRIIKNRNFLLVTTDKKGVDVVSSGKGDLEDVMLMAVTLKATYDSLMEQIEAQATEGGELHALEALKKVTEVYTKEKHGRK